MHRRDGGREGARPQREVSCRVRGGGEGEEQPAASYGQPQNGVQTGRLKYVVRSHVFVFISNLCNIGWICLTNSKLYVNWAPEMRS